MVTTPRARPRTRRQFLAGLGAAGATGLAGCSLLGGDGSRLRVAYMPIYPDMQYFVMQEEGYLSEIPATVETEVFPDGPSIVQALGSGKFDVALFGMVPSMVVIDKGLPYRVVAANIQDAMSVVTHEDFAERWQRDGPDAFRTFREDRGRKFKFGTFPPGSVPDIVLRYWLREDLGLSVAESVEVVPMGAGKVRQALLAGEIDGTSIMEPIQTIAVQRGPYVRLRNAAEFFPGGQPAAVVLVDEQFRSERPAVGRAFVEQHVRATEFALRNPDTAAEHAVSVIGEDVLAPATAKRAMDSPTAKFISDPRKITGGTEIFARFAAELGKTDSRLALDDVFDFSLYDAVT